jgi:epoxyqueuosine reductase
MPESPQTPTTNNRTRKAISTEPSIASNIELAELAEQIKQWGEQAGFQQVHITDVDTGEHELHLQQWLEQQFHGDMDYMAAHGNKRSRPAELELGTQRVISFRMNYVPPDTHSLAVLDDPSKAYISRYALGRDYHKLIRKRLSRIAKQIEQVAGGQHRAFVDSAPVLERALAEKAGLGWIGKNTMLLNSDAGSWFFLAEIYTSLTLPCDPPLNSSHCGSCTSCIDLCPTQAFVSPWILDARKCISYLTIENKGAIPKELRPLMGNRIYGCDDCQLVCPWTKFQQTTNEGDFHPRHQLDSSDLITLFLWDEETFLSNTEGSPIRRIGYQSWLRNLAVGIGNGPATIDAIEALKLRRKDASELVKEHIDWALIQFKQTSS